MFYFSKTTRFLGFDYSLRKLETNERKTDLEFSAQWISVNFQIGN